MLGLSCGMWDPSPGVKPMSPALAGILYRWTTRKPTWWVYTSKHWKQGLEKLFLSIFMTEHTPHVHSSIIHKSKKVEATQLSIGRCINNAVFSGTLCCTVLSHFSFVWLCDPIDCSPPGSSVHGVHQARILEWVVAPSSRGSSWPRNRTIEPVSPASPALYTGSLPMVPPEKPHSGILSGLKKGRKF